MNLDPQTARSLLADTGFSADNIAQHLGEPWGWVCEEEGCGFYTEVESLAIAHCDARRHSLATCPRSRAPHNR